MKILLRSTFIATAADTKDKDLLLRNYQHLCETGLSFETDEDIPVWKFIQDFVQAHNHVPEATTLKSHFSTRGESQVVGRLDVLASMPCITGGDFIIRLTDKAEDRRTRDTSELLKEAATILQTGMEIKEGRESRILKGAQDAVRYILDKSHSIVTPTLGARLSGEVTHDGEDFKKEYDQIESDPLAGIGQHVGLDQMDSALNGARRYELWIHAGFTGHLKCLAGDARIWDINTGLYRTVADVHKSGNSLTVHAMNESTFNLHTAVTSIVVESGVREIYKVTSSSGLTTRISGNHPFRTPTGWVNASDLTPNHWVAIPRQLSNNHNSTRFSDSDVALIGYLIGDGTMTSYIGLTNVNTEITDDFIRHLGCLGYSKSKHKDGFVTNYISYLRRPKEVRVSRSSGDKWHPWVSPLRLLLEKLGLWGCGAYTKFIPNELWDVPDRQVWILLAALWSTDGDICTFDRQRSGLKTIKQVNIYYTSASRQLCSDIQLLLQRVGVYSTVQKIINRQKDVPRTYWSVTIINTDSKRKFLTGCSPVGKLNLVLDALSALHGPVDDDLMPISTISTVDDNVRFRTKTGGWYYIKWAKTHKTISRRTVRSIAVAIEDRNLVAMADGEIRWEKITSVVVDGMEMTYDLSVPKYHNFVVDGFITHNSTLMVNWAYNQAIWYRHSSIIFELEMPYQQCRRLFYALHSAHEKFKPIRVALGLQSDVNATVGLPYEHIRDGTLNEYHPNAKQFLYDYVIPDMNGTRVVDGINPNTSEQWDDPKHYGKIHIEVADPNKSDFTVADLRQRAELIYSKTPFKLIFVDHAGLMSPRKWVPSTTERLNEILRDLKKLAMTFNRGQGIAVCALFQLSREGFKAAMKVKEKTGQARYDLTSLSYANEAERSADIVTCSFKDDDLVKVNRVQFQNLKSRDQKPFETFQARVEWPTRRLLTCDDVIMSEPEQMNAGNSIDRAARAIAEALGG